MKRRVLGILDRIFPEFATCFSTVFGAAPMELLQECTDLEELSDYDVDKLIKKKYSMRLRYAIIKT